MADLMIHAERVVRHSRRFYLRLCAFCDRPLGLAAAPATGEVCEHASELLAQARQRAGSLGRPVFDPDDPTPPRPRRGRRAPTRGGARPARARSLAAC